MTRKRSEMGAGIPEWNTDKLTDGQFLSEWRRCGGDIDFQRYLLGRKLEFGFIKAFRPILGPLLRRLSRG